ncbi:HlyD family secretion protein [Massilia sp. LXY-6]|uniref:HlyD family secretion protein n=1 Tax=Massilia sp. LXY-6 TaxID=3379823 RepID=UPI003EE3D91A
MDIVRNKRTAVATEPAGADDVPLFRPEVLAERQTQWLGPVIVKPRASHRWFALFAAAAGAGLLALLFGASYVRKAHVSGWLVPDQGVARVFAAQSGVVTRFLAREGQEVRQGQPLLVVSTEQQSMALGNTQANIARSLAMRRDSLDDEARQNQQLLRQQSAAQSARLDAIRTEQEQLKEEIGLQQSRLDLARKSEERQAELRKRGFISDQQVQTATEARLDNASKLRVLRRNLTELQRDRLALEGDLRDLPLKFQAQIAAIERNSAAVTQELAEVEARREIIVPAPKSGTVTAIQAEPGGGVTPSVPLLSIVPSGGMLEAHLYTPSRAIGFVRPGQRVLLRYQAYPYQKFGHYGGVVTSVARSALNPAELPAQLSGLAGGGERNGEPVYRVTVRLDSQHVTAYGKPVPLQPGMQLEADLLIERRRLIDWVLDPLYSFTGKWN